MIILLSAGVLFTYACILIYKDKLRVNPFVAFPIAILPTVYGMLCVKGFAIAEVSDLSKAGAMSLFGVTFFMPLLFFILAKIGKRKTADVFDVGTICMLFTLILARSNCIISGCCKGISFFGTDFLWPVREIEIIFYIVLIVILWIRTKKDESNGLNYPIYLMTYGVFRFFIEFVRNNGDHLFHRAHIWAVLSFCLGISFYVEIKNKLKSKNKLNKQKNRR